MKPQEAIQMKRARLNAVTYRMVVWNRFNYSILKDIPYCIKPSKERTKINNCWIMLDTETSKEIPGEVCENYICAWTVSIRAEHRNIVTLYGKKPSECVQCIGHILDALSGEQTYIYIFNLQYDWTFLRKFLIEEFNNPIKQLNTKPHYPIYIEFENGLILRDALILAQRKLEKWAIDLNVEHQKAVGYWDYEKIRTYSTRFTSNELKYIENDTLAGVECLDALSTSIHKVIYAMPWTATGIPRTEVQERGKQNSAHDAFTRQALTWEQQKTMQAVFHGGYTHGNRAYYNEIIRGDTIRCYDFASSYPYVLLSEKYACEKFTPLPDCSLEAILSDTENAFIFKLIMVNVSLKARDFPMPPLQFSKCIKTVNAEVDNGRILSADYAEIYVNELDARLIYDYYQIEKHICIDVYASYKDYLPRWFTDYVFELFHDKTVLKGVDAVQYAIAKAKINSLYGMTVQRPVPNTIIENYETGEYYKDESINESEEYSKFVKRRKNVLNYQIGVWVTSYAMRNLFELGQCAGTWLYSDTDSCYGTEWNLQQVEDYNQRCKEKLQNNGYGCVHHQGREYWLGVAELDGEYKEFVCVGAKRYCVKTLDDQLKITVAGVPKDGAKCLTSIEEFRPGMIFSGDVTGKKTHTYFYTDRIEIRNGIEFGDSIDLSPCSYLLSGVYTWEQLHVNEMEVSFYE